MANPIAVPAFGQPVIENGTFTRPWYNFLEAVARKLNEVDTHQDARVAAFVADLGGSPTAGQISAAFNALLAALQAAALQADS